MSQHTTRETRSGRPTFGLSGPGSASTGRAGLGFDSSNQPQLLDDAGNVLVSATSNALVTNAALTTAALTVGGLATLSGALAPTIETVSATGSVIANAAQLNSVIHWVNGADDTKGVILPATGNIAIIYSNAASAGLKVFPNVNGAINGGSANAAVTQEGNTLSCFVRISATGWKTLVFTANT